jgi:hypothetical protein
VQASGSGLKIDLTGATTYDVYHHDIAVALCLLRTAANSDGPECTQITTMQPKYWSLHTCGLSPVTSERSHAHLVLQARRHSLRALLMIRHVAAVLICSRLRCL